MKQIKRQLTPVILALFLIGCATVQTGNDTAVVDAERTTNVAYEAINSFLQIEYQNKTWVKANAPQIHTYANTLRLHAKQWKDSAIALIDTYKTNRSATNKANFQTAIAVLTQAMYQAQQYQSQIGAH